MKCMKNHPVLSLLLVPLLALFAVFSFGSSSTYATANSITCVWTDQYFIGAARGYNFSSCTGWDSSYSTNSYVRVDFNLIFEWLNNSSVGLATSWIFNDSNSQNIYSIWLTQSKPADSNTWTFNKSYFLSFSDLSRFHGMTQSSSSNLSVTGNVTFTIYDSFPSDCPPCPVCPEVPENPYDNKLDEITHAIYACGATLIVLYFLFMIFKIISNSRGRV